MKKRNLWLVMLAAVLAFGMMACGEPVEEDPEVLPQQPPDLAPDSTFFGTYQASYTLADGTTTRKETVVFTRAGFYIYDDAKPFNGTGANAKDYLRFRIDNWEDVEASKIPSAYSTEYPFAYKFVGRILSENGYVPSGKTAPTGNGFSDATATHDADVKANGTGTECWMYIYVKVTKGTGGASDQLDFIRTAFNKAGAGHSDDVITGSEEPPLIRKYEYKNASVTIPPTTAVQ